MPSTMIAPYTPAVPSCACATFFSIAGVLSDVSGSSVIITQRASRSKTLMITFGPIFNDRPTSSFSPKPRSEAKSTYTFALKRRLSIGRFRFFRELPRRLQTEDRYGTTIGHGPVRSHQCELMFLVDLAAQNARSEPDHRSQAFFHPEFQYRPLALKCRRREDPRPFCRASVKFTGRAALSG